jgi:4-amino-4-deoxy-L-arabinose transferase-like glycosyltransferase
MRGGIGWLAVAGALILVALGLRVGYVAVTPEYRIVHDARDYDVHARSVAQGDGFSERLTGKPTAFRPPGYVYLLGGAYRLFGAQSEPDRIRVARALGAILGTLGVGLLGMLAYQLWGARAGVIALALAAVYVPSIVVGAAIMSEQMFVVLMLAALATAIHQRSSPHPYRLALVVGVLAGLAVLTRTNGLILLAPLAFAVRPAPRRSWRSLGPPLALVAVALATVAPWTIRNAVELRAFVPGTTQLGWALAGTYNSDAREDRVNPASWRAVRRVSDYRPIARLYRTTPEAVMEQRLRRASLEFIAEHPGYVATVAYWNTRRLLDLASWQWSRHTASTVSVGPGWSDAGVICFWLFAALALAGMTRRAAREVPAFVWAVPLVMYLSVVLLAAETPRYRAPLDPFVILLAALALANRRQPADGRGEPLGRFGRERQTHERAGRLGGEERPAG